MKPILTVSNLSKDFIKPLDLIAKFLNKVGQDNKKKLFMPWMMSLLPCSAARL